MTTDTGEMIKLVIADDHTLFREGIVEICTAEPDISVVGEVNDGDGAIAFLHGGTADVMLLDVEMPGRGAEDTLERVLSVPRPPRVAILTMHDDARMMSKLLEIGAHAYISKSSTSEELLAAIRAMQRSSDRVVLSVAKETLNRLENPADGPLSARELEVLALVARGLLNSQIADELFISEGTVKRHLTNIYLKLEVNSRLNATNKASSMGLLPNGNH
ncbi:DNA-binding response regulator, NarL/FixJ family, contains REC and HTH domains [Actinopolyspora lacussalsi subsp. righensis]|uniref:DNA-binding response regulator, NarL/FixJ family, contains REC and HTH domains n=1 Tax=Actinopolyspora righensis TaxID=995060 RepID=A0A1I6X205_9ACTN|nr:response regulator transcription factor [Actinopolyspora righensis]SFT32256.1 DNA-binding response regulator, NarL/FixJ family, contains REC and HTH domains [Actinopolyspora righensis]